MGYSPSPIKRESAISQAAQEICRFIEAERLAPGDGLPAETRLSQMLGISRNSVREALRVLHGLGFVEKSDGRRVVVTAAAQGGRSMFDESVLLEAAPIANEVRSHIAQKCAELAAERLTPAEIAELEHSLLALEKAIPLRDMAAAKTAHDAFHGLLSRVPAMRCWWKCTIRRNLPVFQTSRRSTRPSSIHVISRIIVHFSVR